MARARRSKDDAYILILLVGLILFFFLPLIAFFVAFIFYEIRAFILNRQFELTDEEYERLADLKAQGLIDVSRISDLEEEGSDLQMNADGSYNRGSRLGKKLNNELEELRPQFLATLSEASNISSAPLRKLEAYISVLSWRFALRSCLLLCLAIAAVLKISNYNVALSSAPSGFGSLIPVIFLQGYGILFLLYGSLIGFILIAYFIRKSILTSKEHNNLERFEALSESASDPNTWLNTSDESEEEQFEVDDGQGDENPPWNEVLDVSTNATKMEIEKAWKSKITLCHPDKLAGLDQTLQDLATERTKMLNRAKEEGLYAIAE